MQAQNKHCNTCGAWEQGDLPQGECRRNAPVVSGWPKTKDSDWCCQWLKDERPKNIVREVEKWRISINYTFVRDYPELATKWLKKVIETPDQIPEPLREIILHPLDNMATLKIPDWINGAVCCEGLLNWAEQIEGFCHGGDNDSENYIGLLLTSKYEKEVSDSNVAHKEIPADHPWRVIAGQMKNIEI